MSRKEEKKVNPFYKSKRWLQTRERILRRDNYQCQESKKYGRMIPAETVHHIFPLEEWPEYSLASWNLISLSFKEHNAMHDRSTNTLTDKGEELRRRTAKKQGIPLEKVGEDRFLDKGSKNRRTLILGLPGAGKTTMARKIMSEDALVYDLDYIAAAFRIKDGDPHEGQTESARKMANDLLQGWVLNVAKYSRDAIIIRTAPTAEELEAIEPTEILFIDGTRDPERAQAVNKFIFQNKIDGAARFAERKNISFKKILREDPPPLEE